MTSQPVPLPTTTRASVLLAAGELAVEERALTPPAADEVLVRVASVGVCGSDVHYFRDGRIGDFVVEAPLVLGHEAAGTIVAVGGAVDPARVGTRVSIEPQRANLTSAETLRGRYNLDPDMEFYATPPIDGAFAEFVTIQAHFAHEVPDSVSDDAAALMEPLSVGVASARKAGLTVGHRVLVTGAGPIGLILVQVARAYGASEVIVTDIEPSRLETALRLGASQALDPREADVTALGVDVFLEASGAVPAIRSGLRALRPGGVAVLIGMGPDEVALPLPVIQNRELVVTGVFRYANTWPTAIGLVRSGRVDLDAIVTGHYDLDHVREALESTSSPATLKSMVVPG
ncbi:NAD(P)-dependent alcohol dehydrogenase [Actinorugispora endophytica]|uniref:L-iditol 2-dehydrogenase n=1 Tax=Actinorugispora endophytica TaxID=1605990 RepID=A0A4R6V5X6_9ACTN|nr:NAD(P)-dependent alcohol dehydrogenase [Actinorugispora endophytica]TDQ54288.1 L-iditol 2-dehydrogenase [Actinorugispora endophytica]